MTAFAPSLAEVVRCAGGWLFDQVMAGWDVTVVTVVTAEECDSRALRILGARAEGSADFQDVPPVRPAAATSAAPLQQVLEPR